ncbi:His Kinase A (phospho-acceptor) domain-containing protein [Saccharicrinis carchari]|uniref:histidine kinase n=2 Tax=Saccharicrinis carchari TaxID=1168039 RepID=A0A521F3V9_SACCC|nr:His Kinase A (phospho-acceptor) domain-containing protein [Saccharicrinis carchari]
MSHEIRTPMNAVIGFSDLLAKSAKDEKQRSQVESIRSSGKTLLMIINDILDLSKIEAGKIDIIPVPVNLRDMFSEIENMFAEKVKEKGIVLSIEYEKAFTKTLLLDEVRFRQILFNLIGNAVKFTDTGSVALSIENREKEANVDLTILVKDTGIGIPVDQQKYIFDPFNQQSGQNHVKYGGTGLGLSITKKLVGKMGGTISLISEVGKGSTFRIDLPNVPVLDADIDDKQKAFDTSTVLFKPATVLIVDDNDENRKLLIDLLAYSSLTVLQAVNGKEAVEMAKKHIPDLILMDLLMPVMDGYETTKILKNGNLTRSIPIMAITASIKSPGERDNIKKIFDEYLLKPLDIAQFFERLKKHLKYELAEARDGPDTFRVGKPVCKLSEELKQKIPAFIETLELEFMPEYEKVIKNQVINEIEEFGLNLLHVSEKMNCKLFIGYGNEIKVYAENFDFERLIQTLRKFPKLVDWLKAETNGV